MKTILIGNISEISPIEDKKDYTLQNFKLRVQQYDQLTGEPREPVIFPIAAFNKKVKECNVSDFLNKRVKCECFVGSVKRTHEGKEFYNVVLNLNKIEVCQ